MATPGELIGTGRDCDVFAAGPGRVLRRSREGRSTEVEALTMQHVAAHGYPVPEVFDASGPDIVMQRLEGPTMVDALGKQPWKLNSFAEQLAGLIDQLSSVPLPDHELPARVPPGATLCHLDLHPLNVMLTAEGPVVIDWTGACPGAAGVDAATTWLIIAAGQIDGSLFDRLLLRFGRGLFQRLYLRAIDTELASAQLDTVLRFRETDPNLSAEEVATMRAVVEANRPA